MSKEALLAQLQRVHSNSPVILNALRGQITNGLTFSEAQAATIVILLFHLTKKVSTPCELDVLPISTWANSCGTSNVALALRIATIYASKEGVHHKVWAIDQMVRALTGCTEEAISAEYVAFTKDAAALTNGQEWDTGVHP